MEEYKPKRFSFAKFEKRNRSVGFFLATETWGNSSQRNNYRFQDWYFLINLWFFCISCVFLRYEYKSLK